MVSPGVESRRPCRVRTRVSPERLRRGLLGEELDGRLRRHGDGVVDVLLALEGREEVDDVAAVIGHRVARVEGLDLQLVVRAAVDDDHLGLAVRLDLDVGHRIDGGLADLDLRPASELGVLADGGDLRRAEHDAVVAALLEVLVELGGVDGGDLAAGVDERLLVVDADVVDVADVLGREALAGVGEARRHRVAVQLAVGLRHEDDVLLLAREVDLGEERADEAPLVVRDGAELLRGVLRREKERLLVALRLEHGRLDELGGAVANRTTLVREDELEGALAIAREGDAVGVLRAVALEEGGGIGRDLTAGLGLAGCGEEEEEHGDSLVCLV